MLHAVFVVEAFACVLNFYILSGARLRGCAGVGLALGVGGGLGLALSIPLSPLCPPPLQAFREYDAFFALSRRKYIPPNFAELRHVVNISQVGAAAAAAAAVRQ